MTGEKTLKLIKEREIKWVDMRFTDLRGKQQHVSIPASNVNEDFFAEGRKFDGSSVAGWKGIEESDMSLIPDDNTAIIDPFTDENTLIITCDVIEPNDGKPYIRCPRSLAKRAEQWLAGTGIADQAFFGPEPEFFVFDNVRWENRMGRAMYEIGSEEAAWESGAEYEDGNLGHRPGVKGGYFPVPPVDSMMDLRTAMCTALEVMGLEVELHHHEVGTAGQNEIGIHFGTLCKKGDAMQTFKYCVHRVAEQWGKTATFMPKPLVGDNGNGMHVHQSLNKNGKGLFHGNGYGELSEIALHYIGGIIRHAQALNAFTNASTNSYKRLVPGFEAPTKLCYSSRNRSASLRIPWEPKPQGRRVEVRFPDAAGNPYFTFAALLMAGMDGVRNKIDPGEPFARNLYEISAEEDATIPSVASSLEQALAALDTDRNFLKEGNVFSDDLIDGYIALKNEEIDRLRAETHPAEFDMYYSV